MRMGDQRLLKRIEYYVGRAGDGVTAWVGGEGKGTMDGLGGRGPLGIWPHGGLEYHRTRPWGLVQHRTYSKGVASL